MKLLVIPYIVNNYTPPPRKIYRSRGLVFSSINSLRRAFFVALFAILLTGTVLAKDNLAILPFTGGSGEDGETIAELFSYNQELNEVFNPIPRTSIARAIRNEQNFQMASGMTDPDTIAALGKQLGARYVVAGNITTLGSNKLLVISIIKIDDLQQVAGSIQTYTRIEEIQDKLPDMVRTIIAAGNIVTSGLPKLAIVPFQVRETTNEGDADVLAQLLAIYIIQSGRYAVYPRTSSLEQVQDEYTNQHSGDTADENMVRLGGGVNPKFVLSGAARKLGSSRNMFNASIIDLETGVQEIGKSVNYSNLDDGMNSIKELAAELVGITIIRADDFSTPRRIAAGFGNIAFGLGSFTMGDWVGGAINAGGYALAVGLILWDTLGFTYDDEMAGIPGGIGFGVAGITAVFGFVRPFFFHKPAPKNPLDEIFGGVNIGLTRDTTGIKTVRMTYTYRF
jgi:TolB-like protein